MRNYTIRKAFVKDVAAITEIYNQAVLGLTATFDTAPKSYTEQLIWFNNHDDRHPIWVTVEQDQVLGWAALSQWSDRCAYKTTVEISIYLRESARGVGVGSSLMATIIDYSIQSEIHTILARIADGSAQSEHLHRKFGFSKVGTMKEVGRKFGRFLDVHLYQKIISPSSLSTEPL